ncbi:MAG: NUDIX domain-containing protein [Candidatus Kerfeldbacteria bacterium]|nr:NUDIX domain-containing protein [Candidatus Kerfeldbacteria bacterium]
MKERNKATTAVYLILKRGDAILLTRRQGSGYYDGWYSVPAGHLEAGELPTDCLVREAQEELGIKLRKEDLKLAHVMYRTKHDETGDRVDYFFSCQKWQGDPRIQEPEKCDDIQWFRRGTLPDNMMHHVRNALDDIARGMVFSELDIDHIVRNPNRK